MKLTLTITDSTVKTEKYDRVVVDTDAPAKVIAGILREIADDCWSSPDKTPNASASKPSMTWDYHKGGIV